MIDRNQCLQDIQLSETSDPTTIAEICRFRAQVWLATPGTAENAFPGGQWRDPVDSRARHWMCRSADGRLLASARLAILEDLHQIIEPDVYQRYSLDVRGRVAAPDRVVVSPVAQGLGLAAALLDVQHRAAMEAGAACAARQASPRMAQLLFRRNWRLLGPATADPRFPSTSFTVAIFVFDPSRVRYLACDHGAAA